MRTIPVALSVDEDAKAQRFMDAHAADTYRLSRGLARHILGRITGVAPEALTFVVGPHGKPLLAQRPDLAFNLSHSQQRIVVGLLEGAQLPRDGGGDLGVDVEAMRPMPGCLDVARRVFELERVTDIARAGAAERERRFFRHWVEWEARLKALGLGIAAAEAAGVLRALDPSMRHGRIDVGSGYAGAWATRADVSRVTRIACRAALLEQGYRIALSEAAATTTVLPAATGRLQ
jgi:phosphopantetheinyl transferase